MCDECQYKLLFCIGMLRVMLVHNLQFCLVDYEYAWSRAVKDVVRYQQKQPCHGNRDAMMVNDFDHHTNHYWPSLTIINHQLTSTNQWWWKLDPSIYFGLPKDQVAESAVEITVGRCSASSWCQTTDLDTIDGPPGGGEHPKLCWDWSSHHCSVTKLPGQSGSYHFWTCLRAQDRIISVIIIIQNSGSPHATYAPQCCCGSASEVWDTRWYRKASGVREDVADNSSPVSFSDALHDCISFIWKKCINMTIYICIDNFK